MKIDFRSLANSFIRNLTPYVPGKPIEELEREYGITSSIKLASNENPLGPSPKVIVACQEAMHKAHFYPDGGCYDLKQSLSKFLNVGPEQLTIGNGSENILELIVKAYLHKDDTAILSQYVFITIPILLTSYGINAKVIPAINWKHDIQGMINAVDAKTRVLFLVNPNNPTGTYITKKEFTHLMESIPPHVLVVVDEAYSEYITQEDYPQAMAYLSRYPNLVITHTFSKVYGLAALRLGYAVSSPDIADILNRTRLPFNVNSIAAKAACVALQDQSHVQQSIAINQQGMLQMEAGLKKLNLSYIPSIGNFIAIDVADGELVYQKLLREGVIVRPLKIYDMPGHIRVTVGMPDQNERFLATIHKVLS